MSGNKYCPQKVLPSNQSDYHRLKCIQLAIKYFEIPRQFLENLIRLFVSLIYYLFFIKINIRLGLLKAYK